MAKLSHYILCEVSHACLQFLNFRHLLGLNLHCSLYTSKWHRVNVTVNACPCLGLGGMSQKQAGRGASEMDYLSWESERDIVFADFWDAAHVMQKAVTIFYDVTVPPLLIQLHLSSHFLAVSLFPLQYLPSTFSFPNLSCYFIPLSTYIWNILSLSPVHLVNTFLSPKTYFSCHLL